MENPSNKVASNYSKKSLKFFFFCFRKFLKKLSWVYKDGNPGFKNENIERKILKKYAK